MTASIGVVPARAGLEAGRGEAAAGPRRTHDLTSLFARSVIWTVRPEN